MAYFFFFLLTANNISIANFRESGGREKKRKEKTSDNFRQKFAGETLNQPQYVGSADSPIKWARWGLRGNRSDFKKRRRYKWLNL